MSKILITGAAGYIGSVTTNLFLEHGFEVIALDNFSSGFEAPLKLLEEKFPGKITTYNLDTKNDLSEVFKNEPSIEAVVHFAASLSVNESMKNPLKYFSNNVCGTQNLLASILEHDIKNIVFSSTCAVYGDKVKVPIEETQPTQPTNVYGATKRMAEQLIEWYGRLLGLNYIILRYFNVCGASDDGLLGDAKKPSVHLMQNAVRGALDIEPFFLTFNETNTPDKSPIRDYVNVVDLSLAHLKALEYLLNKGDSEIINIGTGEGSSVLQIVEKVEEITGNKLTLQKGQLRLGENAKMIASIKKAKEVLNWQPTHSLEDSIQSLVKWYSTHPQGFEE